MASSMYAAHVSHSLVISMELQLSGENIGAIFRIIFVNIISFTIGNKSKKSAAREQRRNNASG